MPASSARFLGGARLSAHARSEQLTSTCAPTAAGILGSCAGSRYVCSPARPPRSSRCSTLKSSLGRHVAAAAPQDPQACMPGAMTSFRASRAKQTQGSGNRKQCFCLYLSTHGPWFLQYARGLPPPPGGDQATYDAPCTSVYSLTAGKHGCYGTPPAALQCRFRDAQRRLRTGDGSGRLRCLWCCFRNSRIGCERIAIITVGELLDADASSTSSKRP